VSSAHVRPSALCARARLIGSSIIDICTILALHAHSTAYMTHRGCTSILPMMMGWWWVGVLAVTLVSGEVDPTDEALVVAYVKAQGNKTQCLPSPTRSNPRLIDHSLTHSRNSLTHLSCAYPHGLYLDGARPLAHLSGVITTQSYRTSDAPMSARPSI
jgi:hypothetical protein